MFSIVSTISLWRLDIALPSSHKFDADAVLQALKISSRLETCGSRLFLQLEPQETLNIFALQIKKQNRTGENEIRKMLNRRRTPFFSKN